MTFHQFISILRARWLLALAVLLVTVSTTLIVSVVLPKQYTATTSVLVDVKSPDPILGMMMANAMLPGYMATQMDIIQSERVARRVVRELRLTENPQLRENWLEDTKGAGNIEAWVADLLQKGLDVKPSRESNVVNIGYKSPDPVFAATLANAFAKALIDTSVELRVDPAKQYNTFFDARAKELRATLEEKQSILSEYQRSKGILASDERLDIETQRLNELSSQLVHLQALSAESGNRSAQARNKSDQLQDVITNPVVAGLRADMSRAEAKLKELSSRYGDAHPQVAELTANIAELRQRIAEESRRVSGSVNINNDINSGRVAEVKAAFEVQRAKVSRMKEQRDEAAGLIKDVEAAQRAYDTVTQRVNQTSLESQTSMTNISILAPAEEPTKPSSPKILLNTLVSIFLGTLLATGAALIGELRDRRIRTVEDLAESSDVPVLGSLPRPMGGGKTLQMPNNVLIGMHRS